MIALVPVIEYLGIEELLEEPTITIGHRDKSFVLQKRVPPVSFWTTYDKETMSVQERAQHRWREATKQVVELLLEDHSSRTSFTGGPTSMRNTYTSSVAHIASMIHNPKATELKLSLKPLRTSQTIKSPFQPGAGASVRRLQLINDEKMLLASVYVY